MTAVQTIKRIVHVLHVENLTAAAADDVVERVRYDRTVVLVAWMCAWCCCCCWWWEDAGGGGVVVVVGGGGGVVGSEGGGGWCGGGFCCCVCGHWELEVWGLDAELVLSGWRWEVGEGLGLFMYGRWWDVCEVILVRCDVEGLETGYIRGKNEEEEEESIEFLYR